MDRSAEIPTLLVFTLGPECERSRRRLLPGPLQEAEAPLHRLGLDGALDAGREAGFRIVVSSPESLDLPSGVEHLKQQGCHFADRLRGAINALQADLDGSPLLIVGTDTPDLSAHHLLSALALLEESPSDVVIGPSCDGGFYLLASRMVLDAELTEVRWCRKDTRRSLETALRLSGREVRLLEPLRDLDRSVDVDLWLTATTLAGGVSWLRRWLSTLLAAWRRPAVAKEIGRPNRALATALCGRGPPL